MPPETNFRLTINEVPKVLQMALPAEIQINQGGYNDLPVQIARQAFTGPVTVRLEGDLTGLFPHEFTIPADKTETTVTLTVTNAPVGTRDLRVRASSSGVSAEERLSVMVASPVTASGPRWSWWIVLVIGFWTALLALGLSLALVMGQNWCLAKSLLSWGQLAILLVGSLAAGLVAGGLGQVLYGLLGQVGRLPEIGFLTGWALLRRWAAVLHSSFPMSATGERPWPAAVAACSARSFSSPYRR